jgi:hypothetical protein
MSASFPESSHHLYGDSTPKHVGGEWRAPCTIHNATAIARPRLCWRLKKHANLTVANFISLWLSHGSRWPVRMKQRTIAGTRPSLSKHPLSIAACARLNDRSTLCKPPQDHGSKILIASLPKRPPDPNQDGLCVLKTRFGNSGDEGRRGRAHVRCGPRAGRRDGSERPS